MNKVLIIGQQCYDLVGQENKIIGGPGQYQIPIFTTFDWEIDLLTKIEPDYPFPNIPNLKINRLESDVTTTFSYLKPTQTDIEDRIIVLKERASKFEREEIQLFLNSIDPSEYDALIFSGIAEELDLDLILEIAGNFSNCLKILDLQTLVRRFDEDGKPSIVPLEPSDYIKLYDEINIIRGSTIEIGVNFEISGKWEEVYDAVQENGKQPILLQSTGSGRIIVFRDQITELDLPTMDVNDIVDATGSGDIFIAALSNFLINGKDLTDSILYAHYITRDHLQIKGVPTIKDTQKIIDQLFE